MMRDLQFRSAWLCGGALLTLAVVGLSLTPSPEDIVPSLLADQVGHALAYFTLMLWFAGAWRRAAHLRIALCLVVLGAVLEVAQGFVPPRVPDPVDALANAAGVLLALACARAGLDRWCGVLERTIGGARRSADV